LELLNFIKEKKIMASFNSLTIERKKNIMALLNNSLIIIEKKKIIKAFFNFLIIGDKKGLSNEFK
jgi:hypothetical protein